MQRGGPDLGDRGDRPTDELSGEPRKEKARGRKDSCSGHTHRKVNHADSPALSPACPEWLPSSCGKSRFL